LKLCLSGSGTKLWSIGLYLVMGWMIVFASKSLISNISDVGLTFLILGGLFYTGGIAFYVWKSKQYTHAIWHFMVLAGTIMHFFAVLFGCVLI
jgi:hemolysin III